MKVQGYAVDMSAEYFSAQTQSVKSSLSSVKTISSQDSFNSDKSDSIKKLEADLQKTNEIKNQLSNKLIEAALYDISSKLSITKDRFVLSDTKAEMQSLNFQTKAYIHSEGKEMEISLDVSLDRSFVQKTSLQMSSFSGILQDPLIISMDGTMPQLSSDTFSFDIDSDGKSDQISQLASGNAFLALDKNENGIIDDGNELFGTKSGDGFKDLSAYDDDSNGWIDENDAIFDKLRVWEKSEGKDEIKAIGEVGIGAIFLGNTETPFSLKSDTNELLGEMRSSSMVVFENAQAGVISQVDFAIRPEVKNELKIVNNLQVNASIQKLSYAYENNSVSINSHENKMLTLQEQLKKLEDMLDEKINGQTSSSIDINLQRNSESIENLNIANQFKRFSNRHKDKQMSFTEIIDTPKNKSTSALLSRISALEGKLPSASNAQRTDIKAQVNTLRSQMLSMMQ